jgi:hypothetical protein
MQKGLTLGKNSNFNISTLVRVIKTLCVCVCVYHLGECLHGI